MILVLHCCSDFSSDEQHFMTEQFQEKSGDNFYNPLKTMPRTLSSPFFAK